jgi:acyl-CoA synthetase (AMP-forming)/AMP-acid ligase II
MTEAAHQMTSAPLPPAKRKPGTVGIAHGGIKVRVIDAKGKDAAEGEIAIKGENVTKGYLNNVSTLPCERSRSEFKTNSAPALIRIKPIKKLLLLTAGSVQVIRGSLTKTVILS